MPTKISSKDPASGGAYGYGDGVGAVEKTMTRKSFEIGRENSV